MPSRIISAVEKLFRMSFSAEVAFSRVEPAMASGPVSAASTARASGCSGAPGWHVTSAVYAPQPDAAASAPPTYGVRPLAVTPMTTSRPVTPAASARPRASSSSTPSTARFIAPSPPARCAMTTPGASPNVGISSAASSTAIRPEDPAPK